MKIDRKPIFVDASPLSKIFFLVGISLISVLIFLFIGVVLAALLYGTNIFLNPELLNDIGNSKVLSTYKLLQIFQHIGLFIVPPIVLSFLVSTNPANYLRLKEQPAISSLLVVGIIMLISLPLVNWMVEINEMLKLPEFMASVEQWMKETEENAAIFTEAFLKMETLGDLLLNMMMIALIPAIGEELLFRGVLQRLFSEWTKNAHWGVLIAAVLFSAIHMQFYGFLPRMVLGVLLGYLFLWSKSLWLPIFGHFVNNGAAVIFTYLNNKEVIKFDTDTLGTGEQEVLFPIASAVIIAGLLFFIYRKKRLTYLH